MSFTNPAFHIDRVSVVGEEAAFVKMFDPRPIGANPVLPEPLTPTNPVPEVMQAQGLSAVSIPHTLSLDLLSNLSLNTWDGLNILNFFAFRDKDVGSGPQFPGTTIRVPRGVIFHAETNGKGPPPHTIHWHGIEPTPMNDGVGHCSMEIGSYMYQWMPSFIGSYFYHCHRNTVQHFEFGLYGNLFILPPDAYFASIESETVDPVTGAVTVTLNDIPVGAGTDGLFRVAANLLTLPPDIQALFPGFVAGDPTYGVAGVNDVGVGDPHAFTVPYDLEVMWVFDDRDSNWSNLASHAFDTFPVFGLTPGTDDNFKDNLGVNNFFAFNDFRADYWFITGVPVPAPIGGAAEIGTNLLVPPALNSGVSGTTVDVNAEVGQTILIRALDAAYNSALVTFPVDVVVIAWDGRALGIPPFGLYNEAFVVPAGIPIELSTARRFDALIRATAPVNDFVTVEFQETRGGETTVTARIPFVISG